jgi:hypothetical protein
MNRNFRGLFDRTTEAHAAYLGGGYALGLALSGGFALVLRHE